MPVEPGAQFCKNCGAQLDKKRSHVWPIVLTAVVALLVGGGIAIAIRGTSDKTTTETITQPLTTAQSSTPSSVGITVHAPTTTVTRPAVTPPAVTTPPVTVTDTVTIGSASTSTGP